MTPAANTEGRPFILTTLNGFASVYLEYLPRIQMKLIERDQFCVSRAYFEKLKRLGILNHYGKCKINLQFVGTPPYGTLRR